MTTTSLSVTLVYAQHLPVAHPLSLQPNHLLMREQLQAGLSTKYPRHVLDCSTSASALLFALKDVESRSSGYLPFDPDMACIPHA